MAVATVPDRKIETLFVQKETLIAAPAEIVFDTLFEPQGPMKDMQLKLERFVGGRWYRDLGEGSGHLWGHVQVIKPPKLLELCGPMFMSYPVMSHVQYRLTEEGGGVRLTLTHQAVGLLAPEHMAGVNEGWQQIVEGIRRRSEERSRR
ncbi:MAG TPA: SRPBCC domain-containing protein [Phycisphaerae bacterium]|nr:SRPBCC domain-containing protein [Phycisphaerae bacterium]